MTNILCTVIAVLATNWMTISRTSPVVSPSLSTLAIHIPTMANQVGIVVTNYVAQVAWKGRTNTFLLESVESGLPVQRRSIDEMDLLSGRTEPARSGKWIYGTQDN